MNVSLDLGPIVEQLRDELLAVLRDELRQEAKRWPQWMDLTTAAKYTSVPVGQLRKAIKAGRIEVLQNKPGGRIYVSRDRLDEFMEGGRR